MVLTSVLARGSGVQMCRFRRASSLPRIIESHALLGSKAEPAAVRTWCC